MCYGIYLYIHSTSNSSYTKVSAATVRRVAVLVASVAFTFKQRSAVVHPVSITRFPFFRVQTLENLSVDSVSNQWSAQ